jgi:hypothetical protein
MTRMTEDQLDFWRRRQMARNKARLRLFVGNLLTLGLGENLWYGDRLDRKVDIVLPVGDLGHDHVNVSHAISAVSNANQIADSRDKIEVGKTVKRWVIGRHQITIKAFRNPQLAREQVKTK